MSGGSGGGGLCMVLAEVVYLCMVLVVCTKTTYCFCIRCHMTVNQLGTDKCDENLVMLIVWHAVAPLPSEGGLAPLMHCFMHEPDSPFAPIKQMTECTYTVLYTSFVTLNIHTIYTSNRVYFDHSNDHKQFFSFCAMKWQEPV